MKKSMKFKGIVTCLVLVLFASTVFQACDDESTAFIVMNITGQQTFEKNDSIQFTAKVQVIGSEKIDTIITWSSSKPEVAKINAKGMLQALDTGTTEIKATLKNGKYAMTEVRVSAQTAKKLSISESKLLLEVNGADTALTVAVFPPTIMAVYPIEWTSDNPAVVAVDSVTTDSESTKVRVRPLKAGKAIITMKLGKNSVSCAVTVGNKVSIAETELYLTVNGRESEVIASINENLMADGEEVKWTSSDESVLRVKIIKQKDGKTTAIVQPLNEGEAKLIVLAGKNTDTCVVHVGATVSLSWKIDAYLTLKSLTMDLNETVSLPVFATITPDDDYFINKIEYSWTSSDVSIAKPLSAKRDPANPKSSICTLQAGSVKGSCVITITARGQQVKTLVTVRDKNDIQVESISLNESQITVARDKYIVLTPTVLPIGVVVTWPVVWTSSNPAVATVDAEGKITGISGGTAVITAKSRDKSTTCTVTVTEVVNSILINTDSRNVLMLGDTETWTAKVAPTSASNVFPTTWTSSNPAVATVNNAGELTAIALGTVTITAKASDKTDTRTLTVVPVEANVDFGANFEYGGWDLSGKKLTIKVEVDIIEGGKVTGYEVYDFIINLVNSQASLQNGVYTMNNEITGAKFIWNKNPQVTANISSGTIEIKNGTSRDKAFIFNFNISIGDKNITVKGAGELDRN